MTDRPTPPNPDDELQPERQRGGADPMEWLQSLARRQSQPPDEADPADATLGDEPAPPNPFIRFERNLPPASFGTRPLGTPPSPSAETPENTPPRLFGLFGGLIERSKPHSSTNSQSVQDQDAAAEMLAHLTQTLQNYEQHSPAILRHALSGLGKVGRADDHLALVAHFLDAAWEQPVRLAALGAVGSLGGETAIDVLIDLLNDPDIVIRWEAQEVLDKLLSAPEDQADPLLKKAETLPAAPLAEDDSSIDMVSAFFDDVDDDDTPF